MRNTRQRREQILQLLIQHGNVQVAELAQRFGVSSVTIRSDLGKFESQGLAVQDLALAVRLEALARERGLGVELPYGG